MINQKIKNATPTQVDGISFKSKLEASIYRQLIDIGINPKYESTKFDLCEGVRPKNFILKGVLNNKKLINVTYTPDFSFKYKDLDVYLEVKGFSNNVYPYKRKMFLKYLSNFPNAWFIEVHSKRDLTNSLKLLEDLYGK